MSSELFCPLGTFGALTSLLGSTGLDQKGGPRARAHAFPVEGSALHRSPEYFWKRVLNTTGYIPKIVICPYLAPFGPTQFPQAKMLESIQPPPQLFQIAPSDPQCPKHSSFGVLVAKMA